MRYPATIARETRYLVATFPDCPGCVAQAAADEEISAEASEALQGWLEAQLVTRRLPPHPSARLPKGRAFWIEVPPRLALRLSLVWGRHEAGLTQGQLAKRARVTQQQIAKLEHPDSNPTIETIEKVARALGARLTVELSVPAA